jgi:hypothetical protein
LRLLKAAWRGGHFFKGIGVKYKKTASSDRAPNRSDRT